MITTSQFFNAKELKINESEKQAVKFSTNPQTSKTH